MAERQALQQVLRRLIVGACRTVMPNNWKELRKVFDTISVEDSKFCVMVADGVLAARKDSVERRVIPSCLYTTDPVFDCQVLISVPKRLSQRQQKRSESESTEDDD